MSFFSKVKNVLLENNARELASIDARIAEIEKEFEQIFESEEAHYLIAKRAHEYAKLMAYYRCAIMEIETKLNVLNEEFSLAHDRNPINSIKTE